MILCDTADKIKSVCSNLSFGFITWKFRNSLEKQEFFNFFDIEIEANIANNFSFQLALIPWRKFQFFFSCHFLFGFLLAESPENYIISLRQHNKQSWWLSSQRHPLFIIQFLTHLKMTFLNNVMSVQLQTVELINLTGQLGASNANDTANVNNLWVSFTSNLLNHPIWRIESTWCQFFARSFTFVVKFSEKNFETMNLPRTA